MRKLNKKVAAVGIGAVALTGTGVAYAYWTTSGSGSGSAATGTSSAVTVEQTGAAITGLVPGGTAKPVAFSVTNPVATPQHVTTITFAIKGANNTIWSARADQDKPACTANDFTLVQPTWSARDLTANEVVNAADATIALNNTGLNQDNCKNVSVPLVFSAS